MTHKRAAILVILALVMLFLPVAYSGACAPSNAGLSPSFAEEKGVDEEETVDTIVLYAMWIVPVKYAPDAREIGRLCQRILPGAHVHVVRGIVVWEGKSLPALRMLCVIEVEKI